MILEKGLDIKENRIRRVLFWGKAKNSQFSLFVNAIHSSFIGNLHFLFAFERKRREKIKDKWSEPCLKPNIQLRKTVSRMNKIPGFFCKKKKKKKHETMTCYSSKQVSFCNLHYYTNVGYFCQKSWSLIQKWL